MDKLSWLSFVLMGLAVLDSGCCFLFKRSKESDTSGSRVAHLRQRYWNDETQPCIEKHCLPYLTKTSYIKCLHQYCPAGLLAVPRDLDAISLFPVAFLLGDTEFCADDFLSNSPPYTGNLDCSSGRCDLENMVAGADVSGDMSTFKYGVYNLCRSSLCAGVPQGQAHDECVRERCCGHNADSNVRKRAIDVKRPASSIIASRKRRVNDDVSQCIQSYCSGKNIGERIVCIVKNCNRA